MLPQPPHDSPPEELSSELWELTSAPPWHRRWRRGWRLVAVIAVLVTGYLFWRGDRDYAALKAWRGRGVVEKARTAEAAGKLEEAARLLDQAGALGPRDATVLRALADFCEPREDVMALYALRQMVNAGVAEDADVERLARLAFDWGRPELAPMEALKQWTALPAESLSLGKLDAGARWLASRGLEAEAEARLRQALALAERAGTPEVVRLHLALARLLVSSATGNPTPARAQEAGARWLVVARDDRATPRQSAQALESLVSLLSSELGAPLLNEETAGQVREALATRLAAASPETRPALDLTAAQFEVKITPGRQQEILDELVARAIAAPDAGALRMARWLNQHRFFEEALKLAQPRLAATPGDRDWFIVQLDGLFGRKDWAGVSAGLEARGQPLPPLLRALFLYRNAEASGAEATEAAKRRDALRDEIRSAQARDVLYAAGNLESAGERELAMVYYRQVQRHPQVGLSARLGLVRCLQPQPNVTAELIETLEGLLTLWPESDEARSDLAYLRLLNSGEPRPEDIAAAARLAAEAPQMLGYRIVAGLAALRTNRPAEALRVIDGAAIPWDQVRPEWRAIYACALAANERKEDAKAIVAKMRVATLRADEKALLQHYGVGLQP